MTNTEATSTFNTEVTVPAAHVAEFEATVEAMAAPRVCTLIAEPVSVKTSRPSFVGRVFAVGSPKII